MCSHEDVLENLNVVLWLFSMIGVLVIALGGPIPTIVALTTVVLLFNVIVYETLDSIRLKKNQGWGSH